MPERTDIQDAEPGEESLQVILGALTPEAGTLRWPNPPEPSSMEARPEISGASLRWAESPEPEPTVADATADLADASPQATETSSVAHATSEGDPASAVDGGPGASIEDAARRTGRSGVRPVEVIKRHPGTTVLAAGALVALAGGAVLGGWVKPVSVSLPGTHTILVDPSSHSDTQLGTGSTPATTPSTSSTSPSAPASSAANAPTGTPVTSPAPSGSPSTSAGSGASQGANSSSSSTPAAGTSSTGAPSDTSGSGGGTSTPPPSSGSPSGSPSGAAPGDGGTPTPPPVTTPPTTPPSGGPGSGGLAGELSGVFGSVFGSN